jgi:hypothetical protein
MAAKQKPRRPLAHGAERFFLRTALPYAGIPPKLRVPISPNTVYARISVPHSKPEFNVGVERAFPIYPNTNQETKMKLALFGFAAVAAAAFVTPTLAQTTISSPRYCAQFFPGAGCKTYRNDNSQNGMAMQTVDNNAYRYHGGPKYND